MTLWNYWDQLTSAAYLMSLLYNCCQLFRVNFYLGSVDYQLCVAGARLSQPDAPILVAP